jgi:hypothetical protein
MPKTATDQGERYYNPSGGARNIIVPVPSDSADLPFVTKWIYVSVAGNVPVIAAGDNDASPQTLPLDVGFHDKTSIRRILATGLTATVTLAAGN